MGETNILVCDDDKQIVDAIEIFLKQEGYIVHKAYNGSEMLTIVRSTSIQLVLLDIMMPELDGLSAIRILREEQNIPVIIISAKSENTDKIIGLNFGADDYLTKPFNSLELMARVRSQVRRYTQLGSLVKEDHILRVGGLELDKHMKEITLDGEMLTLTPKEFGILELFMKHPGRVYSIDTIYEHVWGEMPIYADNTVSVHIRHIREKVEINPKEPKYVKVVWGIGYKIEKHNV
jgi:DNA-binding response OmpR family regulator